MFSYEVVCINGADLKIIYKIKEAEFTRCKHTNNQNVNRQKCVKPTAVTVTVIADKHYALFQCFREGEEVKVKSAACLSLKGR